MKITLIVLIAFAIITILITGFWDKVSLVVLPNTSWGLYNREFFEGILVEIHGAIIDLFVVGVILYWFEKRQKKKETIDEIQTQLANLRFYRGPEAAFLFYGSLKHLLSLGIKTVSIPDGNLSKLNIEGISLSESNLIAVDFSGSSLNQVKFAKCNLEATLFIDAVLKNTNFDDVNLQRTKFINASLKGINFQNSDVKGANFKNASLQSANFKGVDCSRVSFKGANLRSANFKGAVNLTKDMILQATNYKDVKLPDGMIIKPREGIEHL